MIDDNNLAQSLLVNKEDFRKTMETNARFQELMMMYRCAIRAVSYTHLTLPTIHRV